MEDSINELKEIYKEIEEDEKRLGYQLSEGNILRELFTELEEIKNKYHPIQ